MNPARIVALVVAAALLPAPVVLAPASASDLAPSVRHKDPRPNLILPNEPAAPAHVVNRPTDTASLYRQAGLVPPKSATSHASPGAAATPSASSGPRFPRGLREHVAPDCSGTGSDGPRVEVMYLREDDQPDRYDEIVPLLREQIRYIDDVFAVSSAETDSGKRVRWLHSSTCAPIVKDTVLPDGAITGDWNVTWEAMDEANLLVPNRKYLVFADVPVGGMAGGACGGGGFYGDTDPVDNDNDGRYPQMARVDLECWSTREDGTSIALHELLHTFGAVQGTAPHAKAGGHCTDGAEVMCYGTDVAAVCPETHHYDIDCNDDDYFNPDPTPDSYLDRHWNTANSAFLSDVAPLPDPPALTITPSTSQAETGDIITFTANTTAGTTVTWSTNAPSCEPDGVAKTGPTYQLRCFESGTAMEVYAEATNDETPTVGYATSTVSYTPGPHPQLVVDAPASVPVDTAFSMTASITNAKTSTWTYQWHLPPTGCTLTGRTTATATARCSASTETAQFQVTATRTQDQSQQLVTTTVAIVESGTFAVTLDGPTSLLAGERATIKAQVTGGTVQSYRWSSMHRYGGADATSPTYVVQPPADAGGVVDTVYLTVTSTSGKTAEAALSYEVLSRFRMTLDGPTSVPNGNAAQLSVALNHHDADITWSKDQTACTLTPASDLLRAAVRCDLDYHGPVTVTVVGHSPRTEETISRTRTVTFLERKRHATSLQFTAGSGHPVPMRGVLMNTDRDDGVVGRSVVVERLMDDGGYSAVATAETTRNGNVRFDLALDTGGTFRARFPGDSGLLASASDPVAVRVLTTTTNKKIAKGLRVTVTNPLGGGIPRTRVVLTKKQVGTTRWVKVRAYTTNSAGALAVRINPRRATDYRWNYRGGEAYLPSTSRVLRLR